MDSTIDLGQERARRRAPVDVQVGAPTQPREELCPTCKHPINDTHFGNLRDYWPPVGTHEHTERCAAGRDFRKHGFCLIPCPTCSGGIVGKRNAQLINQLFGDAHVPFYAKEWTFGSFPGNKAAATAVKGFVTEALGGYLVKRGLYLSGDVGKGKTSLAVSALQFVIRKGHPGCFVTLVELFNILRESIGASQRVQRGDTDAVTRFEAGKGAKLMRLVQEVEWLVLDDLGVEAGSTYEIRELHRILEARRSQGLYTIFTSNMDRGALVEKWKANPDDAKRIVDRLGEYCLSVPVEGANQRRKDAK